jgi:phosphonate transport system substrate-binding protein
MRRGACIAITCLVASSGCSPAKSSEANAGEALKVLRVSAIPDEAPTELLRKFTPLGQYLEKALGIPVEFIPVTDYPATVEGLAGGKLDLVWLGGFTHVQARLRTKNALPIVQRVEDEHFHSKFITGTASGIRTLADLKGRSFAFGSPSSTSGHLMPRHYLMAAGIQPERDFSAMSFSGAHDATAKAVESGSVDAGALNESVWKKLLAEKKIDPSRVREFYTTPDYHDYNWTVRADLPAPLIAKLTRAFLALDPAHPADQVILQLQRATRFVATTPKNYQPIEDAARAAELIH